MCTGDEPATEAHQIVEDTVIATIVTVVAAARSVSHRSDAVLSASSAAVTTAARVHSPIEAIPQRQSTRNAAA